MNTSSFFKICKYCTFCRTKSDKNNDFKKHRYVLEVVVRYTLTVKNVVPLT